MEKKDKKDKKKKILQLIGGFIGIMIVFTVLTITIEDFMLPVVEVGRALPGKLKESFVAEGLIGADKERLQEKRYTVKASETGTLQQFNVEVNQEVKKGDVLGVISKNSEPGAHLENQIAYTQLLNQKATFVEMKDQYVQSKEASIKDWEERKAELEDLENSQEIKAIQETIQTLETKVKVNKELVDIGAIGQQEYDASLQALEKQQQLLETTLRESKKSLEKTIASIEKQVQDMEVKIEEVERNISVATLQLQKAGVKEAVEVVEAPMDGVIVDIHTLDGMDMMMNEPVVTIVSGDIPIVCSFELPVSKSELVTVGDEIETRVGETEYTLPIIKKQFNIDKGCYDVVCEVDGEAETYMKIKPGEYITSFIEVKKYKKHYSQIVPITAIGMQGEGEFIYAIEDYKGLFGMEKRVRKVDVKVLENNNYDAAIEGVLPQLEKTQVVYKSSKMLQPGMKVKVSMENK